MPGQENIMLQPLPLAKTSARARPFIKCAGGKTALLPELLKRVPATFGAYHEPFVGGGALFFALRENPQLAHKQAFISDTNDRLMHAYRAIRNDVDDVIRRLRAMKNTESFFYRVRDIDPDIIPQDAPGRTAAIATWFIYLNKTCFNGLYRENRSGGFNVPFGRYTNPAICDEENLRACSRALRTGHTNISTRNFIKVIERAQAGDFVYFDPPYHPIREDGQNFTAYGSAGFGWAHQVQLADACVVLAERGVNILASNSGSPKIKKLYRERGFKVEKVLARRNINSKGDGRAAIPELLISNPVTS